MGDTTHDTTDHEKRITWLEAELARITAKVDATVSMTGLDTPTPKPAS
jgi:hypothetical protein